MGDIKLYGFSDAEIREIKPHFAASEKALQNLVELHLEYLLGIRLLATEYFTGKTHCGSIDSLGIDENGCPVIIEYKRSTNENVITQALFYLDWLLDHEWEFANLVLAKGIDASMEQIEFDGSRIICMAASFSRYDEKAVRQIGKNIELIRYELFEGNLLLLERLNQTKPVYIMGREALKGSSEGAGEIGMPPAMRQRLDNMEPSTEALYLELLTYAVNFGDDVAIRFLKHYVACTRLKNFASIKPFKAYIKLYLNLNPDEVKLESGFSRDVREIGHHTSGNLEIEIHSHEDIQKALPLLELAYAKN